nr:serine--tRNA ligase [Oscillospiraceae bacterium]
MLDIKFVRENPEIVKENIKKKFQDQKLPMVDEVIELDRLNRAAITEASDLRARRNQLSKANGPLFGKLKKAAEEEKAAIQAQIDANMAAVKADDERLAELEKLEGEYAEKIRHLMLNIPNIIDPSVPIGPDDSANVEVERFGEPVVPDFEIPYHT